ncbi:MAG TPA: hypothetical protein VGO93_28885 [Candidatus Xenobia bacterium]|jgi:hypothetical protein
MSDPLSVLLWFFLASNPSLAVGNHWDYSAMTKWRYDRAIHIQVTQADDNVPDAYVLKLRYLGETRNVEVYHQLNGYRMVTLQPSGVADQFVPFIPHFIHRPWMADWTVSSFMMDRYLVGAGIGPNDRVFVADLSDKAGDTARAMFFEKVGLRRLLTNHWDFSIANVRYAYHPWRHEDMTHNDVDPIGEFSHNEDDHLGPDTTTVTDPPYWGTSFDDHGGLRVPYEPGQPQGVHGGYGL